MAAIPYRKTDTSDAAWDGPANKARLSNDESDLRAAFAWVDGSKDPTTKDAYKGIHHEVGEDGAPGAANLTACSAVIAELNGGRGGFDVPEADKAGIHAHVAHHLEDAGRDAPELKSARGRSFVSSSVRASTVGERITRMIPGEIEVRATPSGSPIIRGYAAVFDAMTEINDWFGSYGEIVGRGCFTKTLGDGADVRCLYNHDPNFVLGRTKSGTLQCAEDSHGLSYEATPPDTQWARDLCETMRRGDVDGSSFGFRVVRERWGSMPDPDSDGEMMDCRTLLEVQLYDVSPVTFPAYPQADSSVRAALSGAGFDLDALARVIIRAHRGMTLATCDRDAIRAAVDYLTRYLPSESKATPVAPVFSGHPTPAPPAEPTLPSHSASKALERFARLNRAIAEDRPERLKALRAAT